MVRAKKRIMIVEDSAVDTHLLKRLLTGLGYEIAAAAVSGEEAIRMSIDRSPDIILMDILLEGAINGLDASHEIRRKTKIPIIFTTSLSDQNIIEKVNITDIYGYLVKPYNKKDLFVSIELALKRNEFEKKFEESENRYKSLFEQSRDAIFIMNSDAKIIDFNNSMLGLFEYSAEEMRDMTLRDLTVELDLLERFNGDITRSGFVKDFEINLLKKDGTELSCLVTASNLMTGDSGFVGCQGIIRDISELKKRDEKLRNMNLNLEQKIADLNRANTRISLSEERYRLIIEGTNDVIFSMNDNLDILSSNRTIKHIMGPGKKIDALNFMDLLFDGHERENESVTRQVVIEKLDEFLKTREPVQFKTLFNSPISDEPREMNVRLEFINVEGRDEILGKATRVMEDALLKYFVSENQRFSIENYLTTAEEIGHRVTRNLSRYMEPKTINLIRVALREMIINAIEHGNLNISFEEKSTAVMDGSYFDFINDRRKQPEYASRKVFIEYGVSPEKAFYRIIDEGKGFDFKKYLAGDLEETNREMLGHGRGIKMTMGVFDRIEYNGSGNEVYLEKFF